jgi:hypothetical protein
MGSNDAVLECEARLGLRLPASVREWFGPLNGHELLTRYSNQDRGIHPRDFALVKHGPCLLVRILEENQGCCWWAFELDGSDDPPVHVGVEPSDPLIRHSPTFSEFVYLRMFDFGWWDSPMGVLDLEERVLIETREPLRPASLEWLRRNFNCEPGSIGWPTPLTHRFKSSAGRIVIWADTDQADWVLAAPTPRRLAKLVRSVAAVW